MSDSPRWLELERLYHEALEQHPDQRPAFVKQASAHDEWLRRQLESLLAQDKPADGIFDPTVMNAAIESLSGHGGETASIALGSLLGSYKILNQIAFGGMGIVYRAEQQYPVRRTVALKIIKPGMDSEQVIGRFQAERQALALMNHPNIARVLDAGTTSSGRLYFAMELVDGLPVTEYCQTHGLDLRARLALCVPICQAIQHAHQKGVIHRDIKPSNVLVTDYDGKPAPKVIDFGIAKALQEPLTDRSMHTQAGAVIGTLEYMSPEQAGSFGEDIDTRSDVYSLGAVLYELIAGSSPLNRDTLKKSTELDIMRRIRDEVPPPPSARLSDPKLLRSARGDLDWVVMKALEKDRTRRYETVNGLARDLERYLAGQPVDAAPPSFSYRIGKFARRHRMGLLTAAAFTALLVAGIVVSSRTAIRASRAEQEALAVNNFLQNDLLAQASAAAQAGPGTKPDPDLKVRAALDRAAVRIPGKFQREPEVEAAIRDTIGQTYLDLGLYPEARKQLERALDLHRAVLGAENPKTVKTMSYLARTDFLQGRYAPAEAQYGQTLALSRRILGPEHPDTLALMTGFALVYRAQGKYAQSEELLKQTVEIQRHVLGPVHPDALVSLGNLAIVYHQEAKYAEAEALQSQTLEILRRVLGPEHPDTLRFMNGLALTYYQQGKYAEAETLQRQTLEIERRVLGPEHSDTMKSMNNLAVDYYGEGKYAEAEELYSQAVEIQRRVLGPEHSDTLISMGNLAGIYFLLGRREEAEALLNRTLEIKRRVLGPEHPSTLYTLSYMAFTYQREGKYGLAETYATEALAGRRHTLGQGNRDTMAAAADLALAYLSEGKFAKSEPLAREALEINREMRPEDWHRFRAESLLGATLAGQQKYAEAEPLLTEGYRGMLDRKDRMKAEDWFYLDRAREWNVQLHRALGKPVKTAE
jgi:serine/threonine protein kinase/tetratricopeptide (TPR) repeat protein